MKSILLVLAGALLISSCSKENNDSPAAVELGYNYFPTDSGIIRYYSADSTYWDANNNGQLGNVAFEIKEVISGTFYDAQNRLTMRVERFRKDQNGNWVIWKVLADNRTSTTAERAIDNIRYIKLIFPAKAGSAWNGNSFNTYDAQEYQITDENIADIVNGNTYDKTLVVLQNDYLDAIHQEYATEKYADGVGMIYHRNKNINTLPTTTGFIITGGYDYTETLISYTKTP